MIIALTFGVPAHAQEPDNTWHVDDDADLGGDGETWGTAFKDLQRALDEHAAVGGTNLIMVAQGTYVPTVREPSSSNDVRTVTFKMAVNLEIRGGYRGGTTDPDLLDPEQFESILSGVIPAPEPTPPGHAECPGDGDCFSANGSPGCEDEYCCDTVCDQFAVCCVSPWSQQCADEALDLCPTSLNAYHVVSGSTQDETAILNGFTIRDGRADGNLGANTETNGGGMFFQYPPQSPTRPGPNIVQCKFINNYTLDDGGAVWHAGTGISARPRFINCQFIDNEADGRGGAAYIGAVVEDTWLNCLFRDNSAGADGGAVCEDHGTTATEMVNCTFVRNTANDAGGGGSGGGIHSTDGTEIALTNCIVWLNTPDQLDLLDNSGATVS